MTSFLKLSKKEEVSSKKTNSTANKSEESKKQLAKVRFSLWRFLLNWTNILQSKHKMSNEIQYAPLRTLDDFILSSARFQLPNFSDFEKWGNRVVKNLCYYQSNYGVMVLIWLLIVLLIQPKALLGAASILTVSIFAIRYCLATYGSTTNAMENVKLMLYITLPCVLALYLLELLIFGLFVFLVPFCLCFVHSSLRLRNIKNKVMNTVEGLGIQNTPMGIFLSQMGLLPEGILS